MYSVRFFLCYIVSIVPLFLVLQCIFYISVKYLTIIVCGHKIANHLTSTGTNVKFSYKIYYILNTFVVGGRFGGGWKGLGRIGHKKGNADRVVG